MLSIARQIKALSTAPPDGVRFVPGDSLTEILAEISGPVGTPYEGGVFSVKLALGADYPAAPPKGTMLTKIFHPNVSAAGEICVNTLKKDWKPEHTLAHVLQVVSCLLIVPFPESSLNDEAGKLFMESYDEYARKARLVTSIYATPGGGEGAAGGGGGGGGGGEDAAAGAAAGAAAPAGASASSAGEAAAAAGASGGAAAVPGALAQGRTNVELPAAAGAADKEKRKGEGAAEKTKAKSLKRL
jgi:ubiquitin-conjugating enzyme E2 S